MLYTLHNLSRKLAGHIEDKNLMIWIGERDSRAERVLVLVLMKL